MKLLYLFSSSEKTRKAICVHRCLGVPNHRARVLLFLNWGLKKTHASPLHLISSSSVCVGAAKILPVITDEEPLSPVLIFKGSSCKESQICPPPLSLRDETVEGIADCEPANTICGYKTDIIRNQPGWRLCEIQPL